MPDFKSGAMLPLDPCGQTEMVFLRRSRRLVLRAGALCFLFSFLYLAEVSAGEIVEYNQSIESHGMGGVRILRPNDPGSMLTNPATLAWNQGFSWDILNFGTGVNTSALTNQSTFSSVSSSNLNNLYGKPLWVGLGGHSTLVFPYFGLSIYDGGNFSTVINNPAFPNMNLNYTNDYGFMLGGAFSLGQYVSFGAGFKRITRQGGNYTYGPAELSTLTTSTLQAQLQNEGTGYGFDLGTAIRMPGALKPTVSAGWKDVGSTSFIRTKGTNTPTPIRDNLTAAFQFTADLPGFGFAGGLEYRNILLQGEQLGKKIHLGLEFSLLLATIRAGFYQGYTTYGASFGLGPVDVTAALYSVEAGVYPGQTQSQRAEAGLNISISFNPDLTLSESKSGSAAARNRLKQRR